MSDMAATTALCVRTRPISVDDYYRMAEAGVFGPEERVELLNGRIVEMPPISPRHSYVVAALYAKLQAMLAGRAVIFCQSGFRLDRLSEPQPDLTVVLGPLERYAQAVPTPPSALLLIEVSQATLSYDRGEKLRAYARSGVAEYWVVDVIRAGIDVYSEPEGDWYRAHRTVQRGETVAPGAFPDVVIPLDEIMPKRPEA